MSAFTEIRVSICFNFLLLRLTEIMQEAGCQLTDNKEASTVSVRGKKGDIYRLVYAVTLKLLYNFDK